MRASSGGAVSGVCDAEPGGLLGHDLQLGQIVFVEEDGRAGEALELERAADVVDVGVGDEDLLEREAEIGEAAMDAADLVAGIDDDGLAGLFVAQDGAVALQRADGKGLEDHGLIVERLRTHACGTAKEADHAWSASELAATAKAELICRAWPGPR